MPSLHWARHLLDMILPKWLHLQQPINGNVNQVMLSMKITRLSQSPGSCSCYWEYSVPYLLCSKWFTLSWYAPFSFLYYHRFLKQCHATEKNNHSIICTLIKKKPRCMHKNHVVIPMNQVELSCFFFWSICFVWSLKETLKALRGEQMVRQAVCSVPMGSRWANPGPGKIKQRMEKRAKRKEKRRGTKSRVEVAASERPSFVWS